MLLMFRISFDWYFRFNSLLLSSQPYSLSHVVLSSFRQRSLRHSIIYIYRDIFHSIKMYLSNFYTCVCLFLKFFLWFFFVFFASLLIFFSMYEILPLDKTVVIFVYVIFHFGFFTGTFRMRSLFLNWFVLLVKCTKSIYLVLDLIKLFCECVWFLIIIRFV